ncbi:MAG: PilZ domain-containing protein [Terracidiphilus sp.]
MTLEDPGVRVWKGRERRKEIRDSADRKVRVILLGRGTTIHGTLRNLSEGGCCVDPDEPILIWDSVRVEVRLEAFQLQFKLAGMTKGNRGGKSFGIEFESMSADEMAVLKLLLPAKRTTSTQTAENTTGADPETAQAAQVEVDEKVSKGKKLAHMVRKERPPGGRERRVQPRYVVEAEAIIQLVKTGELITGYVLEMSQSGCRLYLDEPYEKGLGAHVELTFSVHGIPVRLAATTHVQMNNRTIGVKFFEGSERSRLRMNELITEIREAIGDAEAAG